MDLRSAISSLLLWFLFLSSSIQPVQAAPAATRHKVNPPSKKAVSSGKKNPGAPSNGEGSSSTGVYAPGAFIGARVNSYESGSKVDTIHPGIVVAGPRNGLYSVVMISKKLPGDPPQKPITAYQAGTSLQGNVSLLPRDVPGDKLKQWKQRNTGTGSVQPPLTNESLAMLLKDIQHARNQASGSGVRSSLKRRAQPGQKAPPSGTKPSPKRKPVMVKSPSDPR